MARNKSKNIMPKDQVLMGIDAKAKMMNARQWDKFSKNRVLPSRTWIDDLVTDALRELPGCPYECMDYVTATAFDNFTEQQNYSACHNSDTQGQRIDMTNWATIGLSRASAPHFNLEVLSVGPPIKTMFRPNFDKHSVAAKCWPLHPELVAERRRRWLTSISAIKVGTLWDRPTYQPFCATWMYYHPPMRDLLQSSYTDVEEELKRMREHPMHRHSRWVFVGGDGLAITRINHSIARNPAKYLGTSPAVIPVQGEHPHGTCHVLHMGWRPYWPLLGGDAGNPKITGGLLGAIGHSECKKEWTVSAFNDYDHVSRILIQGIGEYFTHLEASPGCPSLSAPDAVMAACSVNIDLEWLFHYLHDYGFLYWGMRTAVRGNASHAIDLVWRECVSFMHTDESHKTQYASMAIMRIFWAEALHPHLAYVYHANRCLSLLGLPGSCVGWDMVIEKENLSIGMNVTRPSFDRIDKYVFELNFCGPVGRAVERALLASRIRKPSQMTKIDRDVAALKSHLIETLGNTWQEASVHRAPAASKLVYPPTAKRPWESVQALTRGGAFMEWMRKHLNQKVTWM